MSRCLPKATSPALSAPLGEFIGVWVCMVFMLSVNRAFELWVCTCVCVWHDKDKVRRFSQSPKPGIHVNVSGWPWNETSVLGFVCGRYTNCCIFAVCIYRRKILWEEGDICIVCAAVYWELSQLKKASKPRVVNTFLAWVCSRENKISSQRTEFQDGHVHGARDGCRRLLLALASRWSGVALRRGDVDRLWLYWHAGVSS